MTTRISFTPPPTRVSMQRLMTVLSPSLRSCLVCPILLDDPAASSRAETGVSMLSPFFNDLRHDAHGNLLGRYRADGRPYGDDDPGNVLFRKPGVCQGLEQPAFLAPAAEKADVVRIGPERGPDRVEVVVVPARRHDDEGLPVNGHPVEEALERMDHDVAGIGDVLGVREFRAVVHHCHAETREPGEFGEGPAHVARPEDHEAGLLQDRLDVNEHAAAAYEPSLALRKLEGQGQGGAVLHGHER